MTRDLTGRVAVVTGGASGIGLALAHALVDAGATLVVTDVDGERLAAAASTLGPRATGTRADVTSATAMERLACEVRTIAGPPDYVFLNAGVLVSGPILATAEESWRRLIDVNLLGVLNGVRAFAPAMVERGRGHLVVTASAAGVMNAPGLGAYGAVKHAAVGLAANLHDELGPQGVGVSVLCPGMVNTPLFTPHRGAAGTAPAHVDPDVLAFYEGLIDAAPGPEFVASAALAVLDTDQLFVLPSPEVGGLVQRRQRDIRRALAADT